MPRIWLIIFTALLISVISAGVLFSIDRSALLSINCLMAHALNSQIRC